MLCSFQCIVHLGVLCCSFQCAVVFISMYCIVHLIAVCGLFILVCCVVHLNVFISVCCSHLDVLLISLLCFSCYFISNCISFVQNVSNVCAVPDDKSHIEYYYYKKKCDTMRMRGMRMSISLQLTCLSVAIFILPCNSARMIPCINIWLTWKTHHILAERK